MTTDMSLLNLLTICLLWRILRLKKETSNLQISMELDRRCCFISNVKCLICFQRSLLQALDSTLGVDNDRYVHQQAILEIKEVLLSPFWLINDPNFLAPVFRPGVYSYISKDHFSSTDGYLFRASGLLLQLTALFSYMMETSPRPSFHCLWYSVSKGVINPKLKGLLLHHSLHATIVHSDGSRDFTICWMETSLNYWQPNREMKREIRTFSNPMYLLRKNPNKITEEMTFLRAKVHKLLVKGIVTHCEFPREFTNIFCIPKKDCDDFRFILNLRSVNYYVQDLHFKMEHIPLVREAISPQSYMISIDMSDAYYSVALETFKSLVNTKKNFLANPEENLEAIESFASKLFSSTKCTFRTLASFLGMWES
uniref:Reverse transcriptase domain-containing protein n=1 Tax=Strongyloides papillosus TaxID=174720 RepID=A0A0N5CIV5_STREA